MTGNDTRGGEGEASWLRCLPGFLRSRLEGRQTLRGIIANTGWLAADKLVRMGVGLVVSVWVARYLGPAEFGIINYAVSFVALFINLAALGLDGIVTRELVRCPGERHALLGTAFVLKFSCGIFAFLLTIVAIKLLRPEDEITVTVVVISALMTITQAFDVIDFWFQSQVASKYTVLARNGAFLLTAAGKVALIFMGASVVAFAWAMLAEYVLGAVGLVLAYRAREGTLRAWRMSRQWGAFLLKDSWPLLLASFSMVIYLKVDQVMLGEMLGNASVGTYAAAAKISELWYFIPMVIVSSVFPSVVKARITDEGLYYRRLQRLFSLMTAMALAVAVPMTFASDLVIRLIYGADFAAAAPILAIHTWAGVFVFNGVAQSSWDLAENLTRLYLVRSMCGALLNVLLNLVLIPVYGGVGSATATVISYACAYYLLNAFSARTRPIFFCQSKSILFIRYLRQVV